ncbi:origin recognition complex subunit 4, variant 2 [Pleurotus ostreatus]|nr:origin recognition complex subunit 4, variant 2 [Pleurotus ostreatus]
MAVKRKASTLEAPNLKRRTRSSGAVVEPLDSLPATPTKVIRTYGSGRTRTVLAQTQRENEADILEGDEGSREIPHENSIDSESGSEDELMLSPSRPSRNARVTRTGTPSSRRVMESVEIITPSKRAPRIYPSRSSRNLSETPDSSSRLPSVQQSERSQTPEKSPHLTSPKMNMWAINPAASNARYVRPCLNMQKRAILRALQSLPDTRADEGDEDEEQPRNETVMQQLDDLLKATVTRGEGNSCLLLGPRGSGKSRIVERCIANVPQKPIIIRLSGWTEYNDRLAMREIAHQLFQQTGTAYNIDENDPDAAGEDSPFLDTIETEQNRLLLPPPSHLPALISTLPTLSRPTIVILDSFDLFALHPRQALLYCLLDTVQNCRAGSGRSALAVIGITSRLDTTNLLEKRVKSRFSGRTLRTAHPRVLNAWTGLVQEVLSTPLSGNEDNEEHVETWQSSWKANIETFIADDAVASLLREVFAVSKDIRLLRHLLVCAYPYPVVQADPSRDRWALFFN